jgi:hypothetical protein
MLGGCKWVKDQIKWQVLRSSAGVGWLVGWLVG